MDRSISDSINSRQTRHIVEATAPYDLLANLAKVAQGERAQITWLLDERGRSLSPGQKIALIGSWAEEIGNQFASHLMSGIWNRKFRNAVFHADYMLYGSDIRLSGGGEAITLERFSELSGRAHAFHNSMIGLRRYYRGLYAEPKRVPAGSISGVAGEDLIVIVQGRRFEGRADARRSRGRWHPVSIRDALSRRDPDARTRSRSNKAVRTPKDGQTVMTLVLSVATPAYSIQVGDRLVSKAGRPFDALANKNVVLRATDGLLVFGYTGPAYLDGLPTDVWIADRVSGGACAEIDGALAFGRFGVRDVGSSLLAISQPLRGSAAFRQYGGEICAVGWQWDGKREKALVRDVLWLLRSERERLRWTQLVPRHLPERKEVFRMTATGNWTASREAWRELLDRVASVVADWERVQALLVDAIREAARDSPGTIGAHCMSILVRPWMFPNALVTFMPNTPHRADAMGQSVEVSYSPWMVAPDAIYAPAVSVGSLSCEQGLLNYSMQVPEPPQQQLLKGAFRSQERPPG